MDEKRLERVEQKIDVVVNTQRDMLVVLTDQHATLREHMKRSALNEEAVQILRGEIKPIQKHVDMVGGVFKFIGVLALAATIVTGIVDFLTYLRH